jgi:hypothetical protein
MRRHSTLRVVLLAIILILLLSNIQLTESTSFGQSTQQLQEIIHEGDILLNGTQTFTIKNCNYTQYGKITAENNATLHVENATVCIKMLLDSFRYGLTITNRASLLLINSTLILAYGMGLDAQTVLIQDNSTAVISNAEITSPFRNVGVVARYNSNISVYNSIFENSTGLAIFDNSTGYVQNSVLTYQLNVARDSYLTAKNSDIWGISGEKCDIQIMSCIIHSYSIISLGTIMSVCNSSITSTFGVYCSIARFEGSSLDSLTAGGYAFVKLISSSTSQTEARDNSTVWLINSEGGEIYTSSRSNVFVGYDLPLFGVIIVPYTWIPVLQAFLIIVAGSIILVILLLVRRRFRR